MSWNTAAKILKQTSKKVLNLSLATIIATTGLAAASPLLFTQSVSAAGLNVFVRTDGSDVNCDGSSDTPDTGFPGSNCALNTVQAGISTVDPDGTVNVTAGIYTEAGQIVISKNLSIVGANKATTIIKPNQDTGTSGDARGWFLTSPGVTFSLSNVTLDGVGKQVCFAVYVYGLGTIENNIIKNMSCGLYTGRGVYIKANTTVRNNTFENIGRIGVFVWAGTTGAIIHGNNYTGKGAGDWLDYGIELGGGAIATISSNTITNNKGIAASDGSTSAGILVTTYFGPGTTATITGNAIHDNTDGIAVGYDASDTSTVTVHNNSIYDNTGYGIYSTGPTVDATNNWWGDASGPLDAKTLPGTPNYNNPSGLGNGVSSYVDYKPWFTNSGMTTVSSDKAIISFGFVTPAATGVIAGTNIAVTVPFGTVVTALTPTIALSNGASVSPLTGVARDFTLPVTYTAKAADGTTQPYIVTVTVGNAPATIITSPPTQPANNAYIVQSGDTMSAIAKRFGLTLSQLENLNPQAGHPAGNFNLIRPGDVLIVGGAVLAASASQGTGTLGTSVGSSDQSGTEGQVQSDTTDNTQVLEDTTAQDYNAAEIQQNKTHYGWLWWLLLLFPASYYLYIRRRNIDE